MQALQIQDTRSFMSALLLKDAFCRFDVAEAQIVTFASFQIDGQYHKGYLSDEEEGQLFFSDSEDEPGNSEETAAGKTRFIPWQMLQPHVHDLIRGKHTPLKIRLVLRLKDAEAAAFLAPFHISENDLGGLYLNILYENSTVTCTSGLSLKIFTTDRTEQHAWDEYIQKLLHDASLPYTNLTD